MFSRYRCTYCNDRCSELDHVVSKSYLNTNSFAKNLVVPCCSECNRSLGNQFFNTIGSRAIYLHQFYKKKYKSVLKLPKWSEDEFNDLSDEMSNYIKSSLSIKYLVESKLLRLKFMSDLSPSIDEVWDEISLTDTDI